MRFVRVLSSWGKNAMLIFMACMLVLFLSGNLLATQDIPEEPDPEILEPEFVTDLTTVLPGFYEEEGQQIASGLLQIPASPSRAGLYYIGITLHLVHMDNGSDGLSEAQALQALATLNQYYEESGFVFFMPGTIDHINSTYYFSDPAGMWDLKEQNRVPNTINAYFTSSLGPGVGGYAGSIGSNQTWVLVNNWYALTTASFPHEVGHIFYLYHTHQGGNECADGSNCATAGDYVCDTPADPGLLHYVDGACNYYGTFVPPCGGTHYHPDTHNIMSYAPGACRNHFSMGQFARAEYHLIHNLSFLIDPNHPRTIYVDAINGSDVNVGSANYPYATISYAIGKANNNDVIIAKPGNYSGPLIINDKNIMIKSSNGPLVTTITAANNQNLLEFINVEQPEAGIDGFKLFGGKMAVWCRNSGPTISHCVLDSQHVSNWAAISLSGSGYATLGTSPAIIVNNTIMNCTNGGISCFSTQAPTVKNNIIIYNQYGLHRDVAAADPINDYNDIWENPKWPRFDPPYDPVNYWNVTTIGPHSINADPLFAAAYRLFFDSPCINTGDPNPIYNDPDGSRNDMGAIPGGVTPNPIHVYAGNSIQLAIDTARSGQQILVHPGTWTESLWYKGKMVKVIGVNGPTQTFLHAGNWGYAVSITDYEAPGTEFSGFTVTNQYGFVDDIMIGVGASATIKNCIFTGKPASTYHGYNINCGGNYAGNTLITRNLFYNGQASACIQVQSGIHTVSIINNTIDNCLIGIGSAGSNTICKNNIITNCDLLGIYGTFADLTYNDVWNNVTDYGYGAVAGTGSKSADPLYNNAAIADYRITFLSPCKNAGDPNPIYNDPDGSRNDMGVYVAMARTLIPLQPEKEITDLPEQVTLAQNYPNPFNPTTEICFNLPQAGEVKLEIYNIMGQKVTTLVDGPMEAGQQKVMWEGRSSSGDAVASGIYFYRLTAGNFVETKKMTLLK